MAVAARSPGPSDARVPCPLCGGLIHPIAGRCKHCKADVVAHRITRPAADAALPPLAAPAVAPAPQPAPGSGTSMHTLDPAPSGPPIAVPAAPYAVDESRPILPPRPTGRMQTASTGSRWRNWPVVVIVLAGVAIVVAVVLMVWPPASRAKADSRRLPPPSAPERMDTNPLPSPIPRGSMPPPSGSTPDPWTNRGGTPPPDPDLDDQSSIDPDPDPDDDIDPDDLLQDPFANPGGPSPRARRGLANPFAGMRGGSSFMVTVAKHACDKLARCGAQSMQSSSMCAVLDQFPAAPPPACAAAQRCLGQIDRLDLCGTAGQQNDFTIVTDLLATAQDCMDAIRC